MKLFIVSHSKHEVIEFRERFFEIIFSYSFMINIDCIVYSFRNDLTFTRNSFNSNDIKVLTSFVLNYYVFFFICKDISTIWLKRTNFSKNFTAFSCSKLFFKIQIGSLNRDNDIVMIIENYKFDVWKFSIAIIA